MKTSLSGTMASGTGLLFAAVSILFGTLAPFVSAGDDCLAYTDSSGKFQFSQDCSRYCCGTCSYRYCCSDRYSRLTEQEQQECPSGFDDFGELATTATIASSIAALVFTLVLFICCCVCPCCCLYKMCRKPTPVIATTTHTTVTTQYPHQPPGASPGHAYQAVQYPGYQPVPIQPGGYGAQPGYAPQPMQPGYGAQPMPTAPYQGQTYMAGPPPPYQEAVPYSQAAFSPGQAPYPLQPPAQPAQPGPSDPHSAQPAYNPAYVEPPPPKNY